MCPVVDIAVSASVSMTVMFSAGKWFSFTVGDTDGCFEGELVGARDIVGFMVVGTAVGPVGWEVGGLVGNGSVTTQSNTQ